MTSSTLYLLSLCLALTLQSACSFVVPPQKSSIRSSSSLSFFRGRGRDPPSPQADARLHAPKITEVTKMEDFLQFLAEDDRLCVVKFHASWCKSCQKFGVKFRKLGLDVADVYNGDTLAKSGDVRLASIEFGANIALCRALGIKKLPLVHIYKGGVGKVAGFPCGPAKFPLLVEKLDAYRKMSNEELLFEKNMDEGGALGDEIVKELKLIHDEQEASLKKNSATAP